MQESSEAFMNQRCEINVTVKSFNVLSSKSNASSTPHVVAVRQIMGVKKHFLVCISVPMGCVQSTQLLAQEMVKMMFTLWTVSTWCVGWLCDLRSVCVCVSVCIHGQTLTSRLSYLDSRETLACYPLRPSLESHWAPAHSQPQWQGIFNITLDSRMYVKYQ